jgi:hypothetical protein
MRIGLLLWQYHYIVMLPRSPLNIKQLADHKAGVSGF